MGSPTTARAGCTDPSHSADTGAASPADLLFYRFDGDLPETLPSLPGAPQPCGPGSSCSRGPEAPIAPAPSGTTLSAERWGTLPAWLQSAKSAVAFRRAWDPPVQPITQGESIFHPPRLP